MPVLDSPCCLSPKLLICVIAICWFDNVLSAKPFSSSEARSASPVQSLGTSGSRWAEAGLSGPGQGAAAAEPEEEAVDEEGVEEGHHRPHERLRTPAHRAPRRRDFDTVLDGLDLGDALPPPPLPVRPRSGDPPSLPRVGAAPG